jgi:hypothetical protein
MMRSLLLVVALTAGGVLAGPERAAAIPVPTEDCQQSGSGITCTASDHPERVVIPPSALTVHAVLTGGEGGAALRSTGGAGGVTTTDLDLSHGRTFDVYVGEAGHAGGTNGQLCAIAAGAGGVSGGAPSGGAGGIGGEDGPNAVGCGGGGGGGATYVMAMGQRPSSSSDVPLAVAGGGGGTATGQGISVPGPDSGQGGGNPNNSGDTGSASGRGANPGKRGDAGGSGSLVGSDGHSCSPGAACNASGGGGGGYPFGGEGGGNLASRGGGGCGFLPGPPTACPGTHAAAVRRGGKAKGALFHETAAGGSVAFTLTFPPRGKGLAGSPTHPTRNNNDPGCDASNDPANHRCHPGQHRRRH